MSSPILPPQSEDELFEHRRGRPLNFETIETVPLQRINESPEQDTMATLPTLPTQNTGNRNGQSQSQFGGGFENTRKSQYYTQPTQIIDRSPSNVSSPPANTTVQVAASSPMTTPALGTRKPSGYLASAMAPAGTAFRRPLAPPPSLASKARESILISSDDDRIVSDESDREERERSNIKPATFVAKGSKPGLTSSDQIAPADRFQSLLKGALYRPTDFAAGAKRSSDTLAAAYGNASKRPRQTEPARASHIHSQPDSQDSESRTDLELSDILDFNARSKIRRMQNIYPGHSVREMYDALNAKKGNYDDAVDHLLLLSEKKAKHVDLTGSDDELLMTPAATKKPQPPASRPVTVADARQQARKPNQSIRSKWSSTQAAARKSPIQPKKLEIFDTPPPAEPKVRKLVRGRKARSPSPTLQSSKNGRRKVHQRETVASDGSDDDTGVIHVSDEEDGGINDRLLKFFNSCTAMDLADTANISKDIAEHFVANRPYKTLAAVSRIENPNLKPTKSKRKAPPIGEKVVEKVEQMTISYEAVDFLVQKCENIANPLNAEMKTWGIDIYGNATGELDMTSLSNTSSRAGDHPDSGIGTPISDDDRDAGRGLSFTKRPIGQPVSLAEDIVMKDYQIVGINWLYLLFKKDYSCILADDMGLGKTLQTIAFLAHLAETGVKGPHLIVVPAATLENWLKEFDRFCPGLTVEPYYAPNPSERLELREDLDRAREDVNVVVTTYTIAKAKDDFPWLKNFGFCCTIFDEGHVLKNADSKVSRNLMRIESRWRLLLTGTPLQNNLKELMSLLFFLMPKIFKQKQEELQIIFKQDVKTISEDDSRREMLLSQQRIARARSMLTPFILRRKKWQVLKDLPKKERKVELCAMSPEQAEIYNGWIAQAWNIKERRLNGERIPANETSNILMKLRQAAIHPLLFRRIYTDAMLPKIAKACLKDPMWAESNPDLIVQELLEYSDFEVHSLCAKSGKLQKFLLHSGEWDQSGKVQAALRLLKGFIASGQRTLIFSQFVMVLDILELVLSEHGIKFFRLDGNTKVSERQDLIDEFNEEIPDDHPDVHEKRAQQVPVFMLSTKAGGAGINLASASRVIIFDSGFNPQDDVQAENRAHRIGQKREVEVWRLVTKGTVEEQIHNMGEVKIRLDKEVAGEGMDDSEQQTNGKKGGKLEDKKEAEGLQVVEDMFFKQLDQSPVQPRLSSTMIKDGDVGSGRGGLSDTRKKAQADEDAMNREQENSISDHEVSERRGRHQAANNLSGAEGTQDIDDMDLTSSPGKSRLPKAGASKSNAKLPARPKRTGHDNARKLDGAVRDASQRG